MPDWTSQLSSENGVVTEKRGDISFKSLISTSESSVTISDIQGRLYYLRQLAKEDMALLIQASTKSIGVEDTAARKTQSTPFPVANDVTTAHTIPKTTQTPTVKKQPPQEKLTALDKRHGGRFNENVPVDDLIGSDIQKQGWSEHYSEEFNRR